MFRIVLVVTFLISLKAAAESYDTVVYCGTANIQVSHDLQVTCQSAWFTKKHDEFIMTITQTAQQGNACTMHAEYICVRHYDDPCQQAKEDYDEMSLAYFHAKTPEQKLLISNAQFAFEKTLNQACRKPSI